MKHVIFVLLLLCGGSLPGIAQSNNSSSSGAKQTVRIMMKSKGDSSKYNRGPSSLQITLNYDEVMGILTIESDSDVNAEVKLFKESEEIGYSPMLNCEFYVIDSGQYLIEINSDYFIGETYFEL